MSPRAPRPLRLLIAATSLGIGESLRIADRAPAALRTIAGTGLMRPVRPDRVVRASLASTRFGATPASVAAAAAALYGDRPAIIDELGTLTFSELDLQSRALAAAMHGHFDLGCGARVAIMCRNHRGFVQAEVAATRLGCDVVPLNGDFAGPQLADVLAREGITAAVHDDEFGRLFDAAAFERTRIVAWHDAPTSGPTLETLIELGLGHEAPPPRDHGRLVLLTSGTTGTPKGATRHIRARSLAPLAVAGLPGSRRGSSPCRARASRSWSRPPLFHLYGVIGLAAAFGLGSPIGDPPPVRSRGDARPDRAHARRRAARGPDDARTDHEPAGGPRARYDTSSLRMIVSGAAPLAPELATGGDGRVRRRPLQRIRLDGGRRRARSRRPPTCAPRRARSVGRGRASAIKILDEEGLELLPRRDGQDLRRQPAAVRGLHRRRRQRGDRRDDEHRRRRALR